MQDYATVEFSERVMKATLVRSDKPTLVAKYNTDTNELKWFEGAVEIPEDEVDFEAVYLILLTLGQVLESVANLTPHPKGNPFLN